MNGLEYADALDELEDLIPFSEYDDDEEEDAEDDDDEAFEDILEELTEAEDDDGDEEEMAERRRRRRRRQRYRRPTRARGRSYYRQRPSKRYVTQAQLRTGLARVRSDIRRNASGIKRNGQQFRSYVQRNDRTNASQNKSIRTARRDVSKLRKELEQTRQMTLLMTLMQEDPKIYDRTTGNEVTDYEVKSDDNSMMLLLAMGGMGGQGGLGGDNSLLLALALSDKL